MSDGKIPATGPGQGIFGVGKRILTLLVKIAGTRLELLLVELEEEKARLVQLVLGVCLTLLFATFGLMSLMVLIIWGIDPQYRLMAMGITTAVLLFLALVGGLWTLHKAKHSRLLHHTRHELASDQTLLEDDK